MYPPASFEAYSESPDLVVLVEKALDKDPQTRGAKLDILARGGIIVLMGSVADKSTKEAAERATRAVPGVGEVNNLIRVKNSET